MTVGTRLRAMWLMVAAIAVGTMLTLGAGTARAAGCAEQKLDQPFLRFLDPLAYTLVPGGDFEGTHGWQLSGGARVVSGNEPYQVGGRDHQQSLYLPRGAAATSPAVCAGIAHPTLRFFATGGSLTAQLRIDAVVTDPLLGVIQTVPLVHPLVPFWLPSVPLPVLVNLGGALELDADRSLTTQLSFRFSNPGGFLAPPWRIDDVYVDPWVIR
ncbi:MAG: hypothetical protein H0V45_11070 [Actinobacteria bacterium]|nr:hypothetical protein [Actinomycetota bacterium]